MVEHRFAERPGGTCRLATKFRDPGQFPACELVGPHHELGRSKTRASRSRPILWDPEAPADPGCRFLLNRKLSRTPSMPKSSKGMPCEVADRPSREAHDVPGQAATSAFACGTRTMAGPEVRQFPSAQAGSFGEGWALAAETDRLASLRASTMKSVSRILRPRDAVQADRGPPCIRWTPASVLRT